MGPKVAIIESYLVEPTFWKAGCECVQIHRVQIFKGRISLAIKSGTNSRLLCTVTAFEESASSIQVHIENTTDHALSIQVDHVLVLIGGTPASHLLRQIEYPTEQSTSPKWGWWMVSAMLIYIFYILKSGTDGICSESNCIETIWIAKKSLWPFTLESMKQVPGLLRLDLGFRIVVGAFWCSLLYSIVVYFWIQRRLSTTVQPLNAIDTCHSSPFSASVIQEPEVIAPVLIEMVISRKFRKTLEVVQCIDSVASFLIFCRRLSTTSQYDHCLGLDFTRTVYYIHSHSPVCQISGTTFLLVLVWMWWIG